MATFKREDVHRAMMKQLEETFNAENIKKVLESRRDDIVARLLGLQNRWGNWEFDNTNGRKSILGDIYTAKLTSYVKEWWDKAVEPSLPEIKVTKATIAAYKKDYKERFNRLLYRAVMNRAEQDALAAAETISQQIVTEVTKNLVSIVPKVD